MGHQLKGVLLQGDYDQAAADGFDLRRVALPQNLTLFFLSWQYCDAWAEKLNIHGHRAATPLYNSEVIHHMLATIAPGARYAMIQTDYFGGHGSQTAAVYQGQDCLQAAGYINQALALLGVKAGLGRDAFETVGLGQYRHADDWLEDYADDD